jgi:DNA-binding MarR family transcriptional regulator
MFDFFIGTAPARTHSLGQRGLTPNDSRALMALEREMGQTMGKLAQRWECDPANATWAIDRLERLRYATRQPSPTDRRAKLVVLTPEGASVKAARTREFYRPPSALLGLEPRSSKSSIRCFNGSRSKGNPPVEDYEHADVAVPECVDHDRATRRRNQLRTGRSAESSASDRRSRPDPTIRPERVADRPVQ